MTNSTNDAQAFKEWRKQMEFTQFQAAEALGYSRDMVKLWEMSKNSVPLAVKLAMSAIYHKMNPWGVNQN